MDCIVLQRNESAKGRKVYVSCRTNCITEYYLFEGTCRVVPIASTQFTIYY